MTWEKWSRYNDRGEKTISDFCVRPRISELHCCYVKWVLSGSRKGWPWGQNLGWGRVQVPAWPMRVGQDWNQWVKTRNLHQHLARKESRVLHSDCVDTLLAVGTPVEPAPFPIRIFPGSWLHPCTWPRLTQSADSTTVIGSGWACKRSKFNENQSNCLLRTMEQRLSFLWKIYCALVRWIHG